MTRKTNRALITTQEEIDKILPENKELMEDFLNYLETTDRSPKSIVVYKSNLNIFFVWLMKNARNKDFVDIKKRDIMNFQNFLIKEGLSSSRIRVLRSSLSSLSNFIECILDEEEKYENFRNIINKIPAPNLQAVREKTVVSDDELDHLLKMLVQKNKIQIACFVAMAAYSGARKSELVQYKRSFFVDENVKNGLYITPEIRTKGRGVAGKPLKKYVIKNKVDYYIQLWDKEREKLGVSIDDLFVVKRENGFRAAKSETIEWWMKICGDILGKPCYAHSLRHFFVSSLRRSNIPLDVIKDIVGHASSEVTAIYDDNPKEDGFLKYFSEDGINQIETKTMADL
jgi:integrase